MFGCCNNRCRFQNPCQSAFRNRCDGGFQNSCFPCFPPVFPPFPPQPCIPPVVGPFELGGVVIGTDGAAVAGITISYTVNGLPGSTITNAGGAYTISVPANATVTISAIPGVGVTVTPTAYNITNVNGNIYGLDFTLTVI